MVDLYQLCGIFYLFEDIVLFFVCQVVWVVCNYLVGLLLLFFCVLVEYIVQFNYFWYMLGYGGGVVYCKSLVGQVFYQFFGENMLCFDLLVLVFELGLLFDYIGFLVEVEDCVVCNFGVDYIFFVINGIFIVNKIVWYFMVGCEDLVLVDCNCYKLIFYLIIMIGVILFYLILECNELGIIGLILLSEFSKELIVVKIVVSLLVCGCELKVKLVVVINFIYDGLCYNVELIKQIFGDSVEVLYFDEVWYVYVVFYEFYDGCYGMGILCSEEGFLVFVIYFMYKMFVVFSQVSMIYVQDGGIWKLDVVCFNEVFMMYILILLQYGIIVLLDVVLVMMEGFVGCLLIQEIFDEVFSFCWVLVNVWQNLDWNDWWFGVWQLEQVEGIDQVGIYDWVLELSVDWYGFGDIVEDYVLFDLIKVILIILGLSVGGKFSEQGILVVIVSCFFWECGLVVEKIGFYFFLVLFLMGIIKGKWSILVIELFEFKCCYDVNLLLFDVLFFVVQVGGKCYNGVGLCDFSDVMYVSYCDNVMVKVMKCMYMVLLEVVMWLFEVYDKLVCGEVEVVLIVWLEGCIVVVMLVFYLLGILLIMLGECFIEVICLIFDYFEFVWIFECVFFGFDFDVYGLQYQDGLFGCCYIVECIKE